MTGTRTPKPPPPNTPSPESASPPPRANPHLVGQDPAQAVLLDAWRAGTLAPVWLFSGPKGIGKATLAFRFARFLLAHGLRPGRTAPASLDVWESDPVFRRVAAGGHGDLFTVKREIDPKRGKLRTEIVIESVRAMRAFVLNTAAEGGARVVVIDDASLMNRNAANAALKTLEEPPDGAVILLVCHSLAAMLPTIRSRCRHLALRPLDTETVAGLLVNYRPEMSPEEARHRAARSGGSIGAALALLDGPRSGLDDAVADLLAGLPDIDPALVERVQAAIGRCEDADALSLIRDRLGAWVTARVLESVGGARSVASGAGQTGDVARWLAAWDRCQHRLARASQVGSDAKLVFLASILEFAAHD